MGGSIFYITGGTGHLGRNIILKLLESHQKIVALALPGDKNTSFDDPESLITFVYGNLIFQSDVDRFLDTGFNKKSKRVLIHCAGYISLKKKSDPKAELINYEGTKIIMDKAKEKGFDKAIYVSSVDALPKPINNGVIKEVQYFDISLTKGAYAISKAKASNYCFLLAKRGFNVSLVLPTAILGPEDKLGGPINTIISMFLNHKLKAIVRGKYDLVDSRDVASGILSCVKNGQKGKSYILAGHQISIPDLFRKIGVISKLNPPRIIVPHFLIKMVSPSLNYVAKKKKKKPLFNGFTMDALSENSNYSYKAAGLDLGYEPRPLEETLVDTIAYLRKQKKE